MLKNPADVLRLFVLFVTSLSATLFLIAGDPADSASSTAFSRLCAAPAAAITDAAIDIATPERVFTVTGFTSSVDETDGDPCIASDQSDICARFLAGEGICATSAFPFGTVLYVDGLGHCTVADRKNRRYGPEYLDWYFGPPENKPIAKDFGKKQRSVRLVQR